MESIPTCLQTSNKTTTITCTNNRSAATLMPWKNHTINRSHHRQTSLPSDHLPHLDDNPKTKCRGYRVKTNLQTQNKGLTRDQWRFGEWEQAMKRGPYGNSGASVHLYRSYAGVRVEPLLKSRRYVYWDRGGKQIINPTSSLLPTIPSLKYASPGWSP